MATSDEKMETVTTEVRPCTRLMPIAFIPMPYILILPILWYAKAATKGSEP